MRGQGYRNNRRTLRPRFGSDDVWCVLFMVWTVAFCWVVV